MSIQSELDELLNSNLITVAQYKCAKNALVQVTQFMQDENVSLREACIVISTIKSYTFSDAKEYFGAKDNRTFYNTTWNSEGILPGEPSATVKIKDLFTICAMTDYMDSSNGVSAKEFLSGNYSEEDLSILQKFFNDNGYNINVKASIRPKISTTIWDSIITADELKTSLIVEAAKEQTEKVKESMYKNLNVSVFQGSYCCNVSCTTNNVQILKRVVENLDSIGFSMTYSIQGDESELYIKAKCTNGDFKQTYSEEQLAAMLRSGNGDAYYYVAVYCDKVLIPQLLSLCVKDVTAALQSVTLQTEYLSVDKHSTRTDVYLQLFDVLKQKGFFVTDGGTNYEVRWK